MYSIFNVATCEEERFANSFEGIPEVVIFSVDIFWKRAYFIEGSSGVEICTVDNEQEDCIFIKNTGVESVKVCLCPIPLSDPPSSDAHRFELVIRALEASPKKIPVTACGGLG